MSEPSNKTVELFIYDCISVGARQAGSMIDNMPPDVVQNGSALRTVDNALRRLRSAGKIQFNAATKFWSCTPKHTTSIPEEPVTRQNKIEEKSLVNPIFE